MELLVATAIFVVVAVGGLSILLSSQRAYKRISSNRVAMDNINMLIDTITREMKFGTKYGCINNNSQGDFNRQNNIYYHTFSDTDLADSPNGNCNAIAYTPQGTSTLKIVYYYNNASSSVNQVSYSKDIFGNSFTKLDFTDISLTASGFYIDKFWFVVKGISAEDNIQPKISLYISGVIDTIKNSQGATIGTTTLFLESSITQRSIDN